MDSTAVDGGRESISPEQRSRVMRVTCWNRAGNRTVPMRGEKYSGFNCGDSRYKLLISPKIEIFYVQLILPQRSNISVSREVCQYRGRAHGLREDLADAFCGRFDKTATALSSFRVCIGTIQMKIQGFKGLCFDQERLLAVGAKE